MIECKICNFNAKSFGSLSKHIRDQHIGVTSQDYYDKFILVPNVGDKCKVCDKHTRFLSISTGYSPTCSHKCGGIHNFILRKENTEKHAEYLLGLGERTRNRAENRTVIEQEKISKTNSIAAKVRKLNPEELLRYETFITNNFKCSLLDRFVVYQFTNVTNNKRYIGYTTKTILKRVSQHCNNADKNKTEVFYRALRKYGYENFIIDILYYGSNAKELQKKEREYIKSLRPEYNTKLGGHGKTKNVKTLEEIENTEQIKRNKKISRELLKDIKARSIDGIIFDTLEEKQKYIKIKQSNNAKMNWVKYPSKMRVPRVCGLKWYNNGVENKRSAVPIKGFQPGRIPWKVNA